MRAPIKVPKPRRGIRTIETARNFVRGWVSRPGAALNRERSCSDRSWAFMKTPRGTGWPSSIAAIANTCGTSHRGKTVHG